MPALSCPGRLGRTRTSIGFSLEGQFLRAQGLLTSCVSTLLPNEAVIFHDDALLKTLNLCLYEDRQ